MIGIDAQTGQPRLTFGIDSLLDGIDVVIVVIALFALGEAFRHLLTGTGGTTVNPLRGRALAVARRLSALLAGMAARHGVRIPDRRPARRRGRGADVPQLCHREEAEQASRGVRPRRHRGRRRTRRRPTTPPRRASWSRCSPSGCRRRPPRRSSSSHSSHTACSRVRELFSESGPLVWTLIASLYIGNVMLLVLNLPLAKVWARLLTIPAYGIYAGVLVFATLGTFATGGTTVDLLILCGLGLTRPADAAGRNSGGARGRRPDSRADRRGAIAPRAHAFRGRPVDPACPARSPSCCGRWS